MRKPGRLEILCTDLMGPFPVETPSGGKYLLTLQDVASGYSFVDVLKTKDAENEVLIHLITTLEKQTGCQVKILCSDNGGEFSNKTLELFLGEKGIIAERSLPYHHYQNGVVERFNQTVANMGRTVLSNSKLPKSFWGFAFIWANHLLNRIPNKTSGENTSYKALFN
jgi:transposase InsO family protein